MPIRDVGLDHVWPPGPYVFYVHSGAAIVTQSGWSGKCFRIQMMGTNYETSWYLTEGHPGLHDFARNIREAVPMIVGRKFVFVVKRVRWNDEWRNVTYGPIAEVTEWP